LRLDELGDTLWTRTLGGAFSDRGWCVKQTSDTGFIITGWTSGDVYLIKTDSLGNVDWIREPGMKPEEISINVYPNPFNSSCAITAQGGKSPLKAPKSI